MEEALYYKKEKNTVICALCPHKCLIKPENVGLCRVRKNINGRLYSLNYAKPCSIAVDPIEKKPFYHFLPGEKALSIATMSCNFFCKGCQNWQISQEIFNEDTEEVPPEEVVKLAEEQGCKIISYTYTEPTIFYEYMLKIAKLAKKKGIKNTMVSNGYINEMPLKELSKYLDGANVDLKFFNNKTYQDYCKGKLNPVLETLKNLKKFKVYFEITHLLIPGLNDDLKEIEKMCKWIHDNLGKDTVLHLSRFFAQYQVKSEPTSTEIIEKAKKIAQKYLNYVYLGNMVSDTNTYCPNCGKTVIKRSLRNSENLLLEGKCDCGKKIHGIWS